MYDRRVGGRVLTFEASGGLLNSSLVLQDRETDSYWPIMLGKSVHGELSGTPLKEVAVNRKMTWSDWVTLHPETLVLSVNGVEDQHDTYDNYFRSEKGFRDSKAKDKRLATKTPIFAFRLYSRSFAVRHDDIVGGKRFELGDQVAYLYRNQDQGLHDSTRAYLGAPNSSCQFDESPDDNECGDALVGFDTFWYNWSLSNPDTELLD